MKKPGKKRKAGSKRKPQHGPDCDCGDRIEQDAHFLVDAINAALRVAHEERATSPQAAIMALGFCLGKITTFCLQSGVPVQAIDEAVRHAVKAGGRTFSRPDDGEMN